MSKKIIVYTSPACMQCQFTKNYLHEKEVSFETRDIASNEVFRQEVLAFGFQAVPVVVAEGQEPFYGFRPDILEKIVKEFYAE